jgi:hypothetical protein
LVGVSSENSFAAAILSALADWRQDVTAQDWLRWRPHFSPLQAAYDAMLIRALLNLRRWG